MQRQGFTQNGNIGLKLVQDLLADVQSVWLCQEAARAAAEDYMAGQLKDGSVFETAAQSLNTRHAGQLQPHTWSSIVHRVSVLFLGKLIQQVLQ